MIFTYTMQININIKLSTNNVIYMIKEEHKPDQHLHAWPHKVLGGLLRHGAGYRVLPRVLQYATTRAPIWPNLHLSSLTPHLMTLWPPTYEHSTLAGAAFTDHLATWLKFIRMCCIFVSEVNLSQHVTYSFIYIYIYTYTHVCIYIYMYMFIFTHSYITFENNLFN